MAFPPPPPAARHDTMSTRTLSESHLWRTHASARQRFRVDVLAEAKAICRDGLADAPDDAALLHLRGLLALREHQEDFAIACLSRASALAPTDAEYAADFGTALIRRGRIVDALAAFRCAVVRAPGDPRHHCAMARALVRLGQLGEAHAMYAHALTLALDASCRADDGDSRVVSGTSDAINSSDAEFASTSTSITTIGNTGNAGDARNTPTSRDTAPALDAAAIAAIHADIGDLLDMQNRVGDAMAEYEEAARIAPSDPNVFQRLGAAWLRRGDWKRALVAFQAGLQLPAQLPAPALHCGVGDAALRSGAFEAAATAYRSALTLDRHCLPACRSLVAALELLGRREEAAHAWCQLGMTLERHGKHREAGDAYATALSRKPACVRAMVGRAWVHVTFSEFSDASRLLDEAVRLAPDHVSAHFGLLTAAGLTGDYERAMREFAWTEMAIGKFRHYEQPRWDGGPLEGRTILLWEDAGYGDVIQRMRFIPLVKARGGRIVVESAPALMPLFEQMPEVERVVATGTALPAFDLHSPFCLLAPVLRIRVPDLPGRIPYVSVPAALTSTRHLQLDSPESSRRRFPVVGLVWGSRDPEQGKSAPLATFAPLARVPDARFVSLQLGPQAIEMIAPPDGLRIDSLIDDSFTIADTAAVIQQLDLVISVDTMAAHLAGALNRPIWLLLTARPEWRWFSVDGRSPWYPSMRIFKLDPGEDWPALLERVADQLIDALARGDFAAPSPPSSRSPTLPQFLPPSSSTAVATSATGQGAKRQSHA